MQDFQDFLDYLERTMEEHPGEAPSLTKLYQIQSPTTENMGAFMSSYAKDIATFSAEIAMYYISVYHEWLQEQLP